MIFEYSNSWNSPRFWFKPNIGDVVSNLSLSHGLALVEYSQNLTFLRSYGSFLVSGDFNDVRIFGERLEKDYSPYFTLNNTDWNHYQSLYYDS
jgi:hypothetical protein